MLNLFTNIVLEKIVSFQYFITQELTTYCWKIAQRKYTEQRSFTTSTIANYYQLPILLLVYDAEPRETISVHKRRQCQEKVCLTPPLPVESPGTANSMMRLLNCTRFSFLAPRKVLWNKPPQLLSTYLRITFCACCWDMVECVEGQF